MWTVRWPSVRLMWTMPSMSAISASPLGLARLEQLLHARQAVVMSPPGHAAGVEGAQRQLRARLADGLGGHDADGGADVHQLAACQVTAVADRTDAVFSCRSSASARRLPSTPAGVIASMASSVDLLIAVHDHLAGLRVTTGAAAMRPNRRSPSSSADIVAAAIQMPRLRAAVVGVDNHVLGHIHQRRVR
jgi:hypothetical protein